MKRRKVFMTSTVWMRKDGRDPERYFLMKAVFNALKGMLDTIYTALWNDPRKCPMLNQTVEDVKLRMSIWPEPNGHGGSEQVLHAYIGKQEFQLRAPTLFTLYRAARRELE